MYLEIWKLAFSSWLHKYRIFSLFSRDKVSLDPRQVKRLDPYKLMLKSETSTPSSWLIGSALSLSPATRLWRGCSTQGTVPSPLSSCHIYCNILLKPCDSPSYRICCNLWHWTYHSSPFCKKNGVLEFAMKLNRVHLGLMDIAGRAPLFDGYKRKCALLMDIAGIVPLNCRILQGVVHLWLVDIKVC